MAINVCVIEGRLTADPEKRSTPQGVSVCSFCVAVDRPFKKDKERITDFINVTAWRGTADFVCNHFKKGDGISVTGKINVQKYEDKNGIKRTVYEVNADTCSFPVSRNNAKNAASDFVPVADDDETPFG